VKNLLVTEMQRKILQDIRIDIFI